MKKPIRNNSLKEAMNLFKEDYNSPTKALIWGKAITEWIGIIIVSMVFLGILFAICVSVLKSQSDVLKADKVLLSHLPDIAKYVHLSNLSIHKRQEIFERLMNTAASNRQYQQEIESKRDHLAIITERCHTLRSMLLGDFSKLRNPFINPDVEKAFAMVLDDRGILSKEKIKILTAKEDDEEWSKLCALCEAETRKVSLQLAEIIKPKANQEEQNITYGNWE